MKWPWVSREVYEAWREAMGVELERQHADTLRLCALWSDRLIESERRYSELMASYRMLRVQGHAEPAPSPVLPTTPPVDPVLSAINRMAPDARTRASMLRQVSIDRRNELSDEEIIRRIEHGSRPAEVSV